MLTDPGAPVDGVLIWARVSGFETQKGSGRVGHDLHPAGPAGDQGMMPVVLVATADRDLARRAQRALEHSGRQVLVAADGHTALAVASREPVTLLLLDSELAGGDSLALCRAVREFSAAYIMMIGPRDEAHAIRALNDGADDYLARPFGIRQLLARVDALLRRRRAPRPQAPTVYAYGELRIDFAAQRVTVAGREVDLSPTEFRLLAALARHPGLVLTQHQLREAVWGPAYGPDRNLLHVNVRRLRRKLEPDPSHPRYLLTQHGVGYFVPKPR